MVGFPLLLIPLAVYNIIVFLMPGVSITEPLFRVMLVSGAEWPVTLSDILVALGMLLLLLEVIKGARPGAKYVMDHLLSLVVFGAAAAEFLLWPKFASSTFFLLTLLALVDFLSGVALRTRRSRYYVPAPAPQAVPQATPPSPTSPTATQASAASVGRSVLHEHSAPQSDRPAAAPGEGSPQVASPELQPGASTPTSPDAPKS